MEDCIFCKIINNEVPSYKVYEDDRVLAFLDITPVNPGHTLVIPKKHSENIEDITEDDLAAVLKAAKKIAKTLLQLDGVKGVNIMNNNRSSAGQVVMHSHFHVVPRYENDGLTLWPGKEYSEGEAESILSEVTGNL